MPEVYGRPRLQESNGMRRDCNEDGALPYLFEAQVELKPDAVAVVFANESLSYRELNERANRLAHHLVSVGVKPERLVGICLERTAELVVGLLGVLKAGGAYLPLNSEYPEARLAYLIADAAPVAILTTVALSERFNHNSEVILVDAPDTQRAIADAPVHNPTNPDRRSRLLPMHAAYVIYTSGSTGKPKGVVIEHRSTMRFAEWAGATFTAHEWSGVLASTSIAFDLSVFELFVTLFQGGCVILANSALELPVLPARDRVRLINTVPSIARSLLYACGLPPAVRSVNLAGEALRNSLVQDLYGLDHLDRVFNLYGPSEATTYATFTLCSRYTDEEPTIGLPIRNTQAYVLDPDLNQVLSGIAGELFLGGAGLARGYLNRPALTA